MYYGMEETHTFPQSQLVENRWYCPFSANENNLNLNLKINRYL